jgi:hypothetical protein
MSNLINSNTSIFIGGVEVWDEGTRERFDRQTNRAVRTLVCRWSDRANLIRQIRGDDTISVGNVDVFPAQAYPDFDFLYPESFEIEGIPPMTSSARGLPSYAFARVKVTYSTLDPGDEALDVASQVLTLPRTGPVLKFVGSSEEVPFQDSPGYALPVLTHTKGLVRLSGIPRGKLINAAKKPLNETEFLGYPPRTVLFDGGRGARYTYASATGGVVYDLFYRFLARPALPWDVLPVRKADGSFEFKQVEFIGTNPATGDNSYIGQSDLNELLRRD